MVAGTSEQTQHCGACESTDAKTSVHRGHLPVSQPVGANDARAIEVHRPVQYAPTSEIVPDFASPSARRFYIRRVRRFGAVAKKPFPLNGAEFSQT